MPMAKRQRSSAGAVGEQLADQLRLAAEGHAGKLLEALDHAVDGRHQPLFLRGVVAVVAVIFQHGKRQRQKSRSSACGGWLNSRLQA